MPNNNKRFRSSLWWVIGLSLMVGCQKNNDQRLSQPYSQWFQSQSAKSSRVSPDISEPDIQPVTHFAAGQMLESQKYFPQAIEQYQKSIQLKRDFVAAYNRIGICLNQVREHGEADKFFREAIKYQPDAAYLYNNLAFSLMLQQRDHEAEQELRKALQFQPSYDRARANLAIIYARQQRFDESFKEFATVLGESRAYYNLGILYKAQGKYQNAADSFRLASELDARLAKAAGLQISRLQSYLTNEAFASTVSKPISNLNTDTSEDTHLSESIPMDVVSAPTKIKEWKEESAIIDAAVAPLPESELESDAFSELAEVDTSHFTTSDSKSARAIPAGWEHSSEITSMNVGLSDQAADEIDIDVEMVVNLGGCDQNAMEEAIADWEQELATCQANVVSMVYLGGGPSALFEAKPILDSFLAEKATEYLKLYYDCLKQMVLSLKDVARSAQDAVVTAWSVVNGPLWLSEVENFERMVKRILINTRSIDSTLGDDKALLPELLESAQTSEWLLVNVSDMNLADIQTFQIEQSSSPPTHTIQASKSVPRPAR